MTPAPRALEDAANPTPLAVPEFFERCMHSIDVAALILDKFERQLGADIPEIERSLAARDSAPIARTSHALKGAAGAVAASTLRNLAAEIETHAKNDHFDLIEGAMTRLRSEAARCIAYLPVAREVLRTVASGGTQGKDATP